MIVSKMVKKSIRWHIQIKSVVLHIILLLGTAISLFPFYWLIVMATRKSSDIFSYPPKLVFGSQLWENIVHVWLAINFFGAFTNTLLVACTETVLVVFFCSLAGFTFAKFTFRGKNPLFVILLVTMMIPSQLSAVPSFVLMARLGWVSSFKALIVPGMVTAFGIFWMRQYASSSVPGELIDAGRIDGCGHFRLYWHIALPVLRPALAFLGIFTFIHAWNDYMWPLIILNDPAKYTLQVALSQLNGIYSTDYGMVMAGALLATIPLLIIFLLGSRHFIANIAAGALKE
ncbi:carbohydrate ABC transporter permease [Dictyobacter arantiisoli]|uniref:Sugar ABC transporter permease n=1 Tax=Dictyobacter arantiisoli TaxID=2014874 RepID=A0A5A5TJ08_9CHLR|nr:carbohydrate ABC transporter permease [Dictyobacter arantiisoli]GCF11106.1 sugar ABC transporter permease [Dictyobacter arantiisoli]